MKRFLTSAICAIIVATTIMFSGCGASSGNVNSEIADLKQQIADLQEELNGIGTGLGTDLSGVNSEIALLKQQIVALQELLQSSTGDVISLQAQLVVLQTNFNKLNQQVNGVPFNYLKVNETSTFSFGGNKVFDFTPTRADACPHVVVDFNSISYIQGLSLTMPEFELNAILYLESTNRTYELRTISTMSSPALVFTGNEFPNNIESCYVYIFCGATMFGAYEFSFV